MLNLNAIKAISIDLDDTLWPTLPVLVQAEKVLNDWLGTHAPMAAALFANPLARQDLRIQVIRMRPELRFDLGSVRKEAIRLALYRAGENPLLAEAAFTAYYNQRNRVPLFDDALASLEFLSGRFPLVALSNGNADIHRIGIGSFFKSSLSATSFGFAKPDVRIFQAAADSVSLQPGQMLHVGDDATMDVLGAINSGMQAVWLNRSDIAWPYAHSYPHKTVDTLKALCDLFKSNDSVEMALEPPDSTMPACLEGVDIFLPLEMVS